MDLLVFPAALKQLKALPSADAKRLLEALQAIADAHPQRLSLVTQMLGHHGIWRARKGDYRAVYAMEGDTMTVVAVGHRKDMYE